MAILKHLLAALVACTWICGTQGLIAASSSGALLTQTSNGLRCQVITVTACQGLGYNMTALPNLAGHTNQLEAELRVGTFKIKTFLLLSYHK